MLREQFTTLKFDGYVSDHIPIDNGIGQGDPLSMVLYRYYNADLLDIPKCAKEDAVAYMDDCYDPGPYHQFSLIFHHLFLHSQSLVPHSFPYAPLGPPPNHLTSHLMDHLTIPQSDITCHHSTVRSTPQHHHLTLYGLPAHDALFLDCQLMMELYLELPRHDTPY